MATEQRIVIEGVKNGRPFRETEPVLNNNAAERMQQFRERIEDPPVEGLLSYRPTILRAELEEREVTPWVGKDMAGGEPIVDAWLESGRYRVRDMADVEELRSPRIGGRSGA